MDVHVETTPTAEPVKRAVLTHKSDLGTAIGIWLINSLLRVVTFGLYHFWAVARERRFLWSHTRLVDDRLEYTGTGWELFKGWFLVLLILILPVTIIQGVAVVNPSLAAIFGALSGLIFILLIPLGVFLSNRYILGRTLWRGVRFRQAGRMGDYWRLSIGQTLLTLVTLGVWIGKAEDRRARYLWGHTHVGDQQFDVGDNRPPMILRTLAAIMIPLLVYGLSTGFLFLIGFGVATQGQSDAITMVGEIGFVLISITSFFVLPLTILLSSAMIFSRIYVFLISDTGIGRCRLHSTITLGSYLKRAILALLVLIVTLGSGMFLVRRLWLNYFSEHLSMTGEPDYAAIGQTTQDGGGVGDALLDAADAGGGFGM